MKVVFIKVHPPYTVCPEEEWCKREYRERWMVRQTRGLGHEASLYLLTNKKEVWSYQDSVQVKFFPGDNQSGAKQEHTSKLMLEALEKEKPEVIIYKGLDAFLRPDHL